MHTDLDHPHVHLTLDFIVLLLGRGLLLLADPAAEASREGDLPARLRVRPTLYDPAALEVALSAFSARHLDIFGLPRVRSS